MTFTIVHILASGGSYRPHFIRTLLCGDMPEDIEYYVFAQNIGSSKKYHGSDYIKNNIYAKPTLVKYFTRQYELDLLMSTMVDKRGAILLSIGLTNKYVSKYVKYKNMYNLPIFFMIHGITTPYATNIVANAWRNDFYRGMYSYFCGPVQNAAVRAAGFHKSTYTTLGGLPQFDYLLSMREDRAALREKLYRKYKLKSSDKTILILNQMFYTSGNVKGFARIINLVSKTYPDHYLLLKTKCTTGHSNLINYIRKTKFRLPAKTYLVPWSTMVYDYLCCDKILCIGFSTCFIEALLVQPQVLLFQQKGKFYYKPKKHVLIADTVTELKKNLIIANNPKHFKTDAYKKDVEETMIEMIGVAEPVKVSSFVANDIMKRALTTKIQNPRRPPPWQAPLTLAHKHVRARIQARAKAFQAMRAQASARHALMRKAGAIRAASLRQRQANEKKKKKKKKKK
jgi:hypothetical protein